jgi:hypothetical protein
MKYLSAIICAFFFSIIAGVVVYAFWAISLFDDAAILRDYFPIDLDIYLPVALIIGAIIGLRIGYCWFPSENKIDS